MNRPFPKLGLITLLMLVALSLTAQFGKNKPHYEKFEFEVLETPNFSIHHYLQNRELLERLAAQSEHWYDRHQQVLHDTIRTKNPIIFYNDHPDFQQTTAVQGAIGVGTGGVTEAFKNRVVMPLGMSNAQTDHVLGHELVHAFQYNLVLRGDSTNIRNLRNLPLWMVEGLAEYLSIGREDAHTAMWMRDAVLHDDVPTLKQLDSGRYFPYRWGQVFWAFVTGIYGDDIIEPYFTNTAKYGLEVATTRTLGTTKERLSELFVEAIKKQYGADLPAVDTPVGKQLASDENSGRLNIAPRLSPNGRYLIYLSEKDVFGIDLFLADARTGKVIRKVASMAKDGHLDDFAYIESAGTWSPDSEQFAFVAVKKGNNVLIVKDVQTGRTVRELTLEDVPAFSNPVWAPDGERIVVTGLRDGWVDLFAVQPGTGKTTRLTNDYATEMHPDFSFDGTRLVFATDALAVQRGAGKLRFNLATLDLATGEKTNHTVFPGADNLNPVFDNRDDILFLSNRDGRRNLYRYVPDSTKVYQLTDLATGISGITAFAPAITSARSPRRNTFVYTYFGKGKYELFRARPDDFTNRAVDPNAVDLTAALLPKVNKRAPVVVDDLLTETAAALPVDSLTRVPYDPKFKLDFVDGSGGLGVGVGGPFGTQTGAMGGVSAIFGDMLGQHQLFAGASLNGEIYDFAASFSYLNQKGRIPWGVSISHRPFLSGRGGFAGLDTLSFGGEPFLAQKFLIDRIRTFEERIGGFAQLPFSKSLRLEGGLSMAFYHNRIDRFENYYDNFGRLVYQERDKLPVEESGLNLFRGALGTASVALVGDNSFSGLTAPLQGHRFRFGVDRYLGDFNFWNVTADYRKYLRMKPMTLAVRASHYGRYGQDANAFFPYFLGQSWFVRGYQYNGNTEQLLAANGRSINDLFGSKIAVTSAELRLPFTGPEQLALIKSKFLLTDLNLFIDGGLAFSSTEQFLPGPEGGTNPFAPRPVFSAGVSARVNLFGAMVLEPFYAFPLQAQTRGTFGLNITPGW